jgi:hypothetical protein
VVLVRVLVLTLTVVVREPETGLQPVQELALEPVLEPDSLPLPAGFVFVGPVAHVTVSAVMLSVVRMIN